MQRKCASESEIAAADGATAALRSNECKTENKSPGASEKTLRLDKLIALYEAVSVSPRRRANSSAIVRPPTGSVRAADGMARPATTGVQRDSAQPNSSDKPVETPLPKIEADAESCRDTAAVLNVSNNS